ncbi:MAG TPA: GAP family protein [Solirubrobacteraceae bacterium]
MAQIYVLALYAAVYPALLAAVGILLASPRRNRLLTAFLVVGMTVSVGWGIGIVLLIHGSGAVRDKGSGWSWGTDLAVGIVALLLALGLATHAWGWLRGWRAARRSDREDLERGSASGDREPWSRRLLGRGSLPVVIMASVALNLPGAVYLVALKDIASGRRSVPEEVGLVIAFNLIMFVLAEIPWLGLMFAPKRTEALVGKAIDFLARHGNKLAIAVCVVVGVHLIIRGVIRS